MYHLTSGWLYELVTLHTACFDCINILRILQNLLFLHTSFGVKVSLIFPIIDLKVDLRSNLHIGLSDLVNPLIFADSCPG